MEPPDDKKFDRTIKMDDAAHVLAALRGPGVPSPGAFPAAGPGVPEAPQTQPTLPQPKTSPGLAPVSVQMLQAQAAVEPAVDGSKHQVMQAVQLPTFDAYAPTPPTLPMAVPPRPAPVAVVAPASIPPEAYGVPKKTNVAQLLLVAGAMLVVGLGGMLVVIKATKPSPTQTAPSASAMALPPPRPSAEPDIPPPPPPEEAAETAAAAASVAPAAEPAAAPTATAAAAAAEPAPAALPVPTGGGLPTPTQGGLPPPTGGGLSGLPVPTSKTGGGGLPVPTTGGAALPPPQTKPTTTGLPVPTSSSKGIVRDAPF